MQAIGSGDHTELTAGDALQIARKASPLNQIDHDAADPQGLTPGQTVSVVPLGDGGDPVVSGDLIAANAHTMALARQDEQVGDVTVYFPRVGYRVTVH